jgi:hypothetical protein
MLPDGSYRMSQTDAGEAVGLSERNARDFLKTKALKSLLGEGYTPAISAVKEIEIDPSAQTRRQSRFNADDITRENEELWFYIRKQGLPGPYSLEDWD